MRGEHYWIIGASSGIGRALALELAARGATLTLSARREDALLAVRQEMVGAQHAILPLDVANTDQIYEAATRITRPLAGVIIMAAIYEPQAIADIQPQMLEETIRINLLGSIHAALAVLPLLREQGRGVLALCGSVAGYRGLPNGQPYSATKAAITNFAESLAVEEKPNGIQVKLISPGFVETPMTARNQFTMPMIITPQQAAIAIADGLHQSGFEIHFPKRFTLGMKLLQLLPYCLYFRIAESIRKQNEK
jgi:NAD(P)-dependent dehydrogenase (short-subunit alcohol dehydrogenase family)